MKQLTKYQILAIRESIIREKFMDTTNQ